MLSEFLKKTNIIKSCLRSDQSTLSVNATKFYANKILQYPVIYFIYYSNYIFAYLRIFITSLYTK